VIKVRQHQVVVRLSSWHLAGRSTVTCYLSITAVEVVRSKLYEMSVYEQSGLPRTQEENRRLYRQELQCGVNTYASAVDAVRYVQHKSTVVTKFVPI
jgi:hypothetical protein